jgi:hypothetical protein
MDCHNHMRNIFVAKTVTNALDPTLSVKASHLAFARAHEKLFARAANYPKGGWEQFKGYLL